MILAKVVKSGDVVSLELSEEALALLGAAPGDLFALSPADGGGVLLAAPPTQGERRERGRAFLNRYRETFEALAK